MDDPDDANIINGTVYITLWQTKAVNMCNLILMVTSRVR